VGFVDTTPEVLVKVDTMIAETHERIARFDPELIPHYNGFVYDVMPAFALA